MKIYYDAEGDALYIEFHPLADGTAEARPKIPKKAGLIAGLFYLGVTKMSCGLV